VQLTVVLLTGDGGVHAASARSATNSGVSSIAGARRRIERRTNRRRAISLKSVTFIVFVPRSKPHAQCRRKRVLAGLIRSKEAAASI